MDFYNNTDIPHYLKPLTDPQVVLDYAKHAIECALPEELEKVICKDPWCYVEYASEVLDYGDRIPLGEEAILNEGDIDLIFDYLSILNSKYYNDEMIRVPKLEKELRKNPQYSYKFCSEILNRPDPEFENSIFSDIEYGYYYITELVMSRNDLYEEEVYNLVNILKVHYVPTKAYKLIYFLNYCENFNIIPGDLHFLKDVIDLTCDYNKTKIFCKKYNFYSKKILKSSIKSLCEKPNNSKSWNWEFLLEYYIKTVTKYSSNSFNLLKSTFEEYLEKNEITSSKRFIICLFNTYENIIKILNYNKELRRWDNIEKYLMPNKDLRKRYLELLKN